MWTCYPIVLIGSDVVFERISAITFATHDMRTAVQFYRDIGFELKYGGEDATFSSFYAGDGFVNLTLQPIEKKWTWWGRTIFHVADVDEIYKRAINAGYNPETPPTDASWGERYFHLVDPDGHELSFARPLRTQ